MNYENQNKVVQAAIQFLLVKMRMRICFVVIWGGNNYDDFLKDL